MKIMIVTVPLRPVPTNYPPMGSLSIINYLRKRGIDNVELYNIDANRPCYEDVLEHLRAEKPDVLGISAVVSTSYAYTKQLSLDVKRILPDTLVVVGGNLAASAEILLRKTGVDLCVLGEGEITFLNVVTRAATTHRPADFKDISGLALVDADGGLVNTGYEKTLPKEELYDLNWKDLENSTDISLYVYDPCEEPWLVHDPRSKDTHRIGKKAINLHAAKGCVARCTFCHRFDKGVRYIPNEILRGRIRHLIDNYNVGYITIADENFGTDRKWLKSFCEMIAPFDILWRVGGMRVNCVSPEQIDMMKNAGCVAIFYGMETGSARILEVMEKKTTIEQNHNALNWTINAGLYSIIQLVIGMPGENPETISETIDFCRRGLQLSPVQNPNNLSINYAQALPGTPLYEFARGGGISRNRLTAKKNISLEYPTKMPTMNSRPLTLLIFRRSYVRHGGQESPSKQITHTFKNLASNTIKMFCYRIQIFFRKKEKPMAGSQILSVSSIPAWRPIRLIRFPKRCCWIGPRFQAYGR